MSFSTLNVLIAGGGICGLSCAVALRRSGHNVRVLERSQFSNEVGAAITLSPNATRILRSWDLDFRKAQMVEFQGMEIVTADGDSISSRNQHDFSRVIQNFGSPYLLSHRVDLHEPLRDLATSPRGLGKPVEIINGARIVSFDAEAGSVELADGSRLQGDLVIAADGVHSIANKFIGVDKPVIPSDTTVARFLVPTATMLDDPATKNMISGDGVSSVYFSTAHENRWLLRYPCRNNQLQNLAFYSIDPLQSESRNLTTKYDRESLLRSFNGFPSYVLATAAKAQQVLPLWRCAFREPLAHMYRGRLVLAGDAAHAMLPHLGQGAAQSIEDAAALGTLFQDIYIGKHEHQSRKIIESRLALFERVRKDRVTGIQILSSVPLGESDFGRAQQKWEEYLPGHEFPRQKGETFKFCNSHDVVKECLALLNPYDENFGRANI